MKRQFKAICKIKNGALHIPDKLKPLYNNMIAWCDKYRGGNIELIIRPPEKPRTTGDNSQNHYINGACRDLGFELGYTLDEVKHWAKMEAITLGYPYKTIRTIIYPASEADISTVEANYLIQTLNRLSAEYGLLQGKYKGGSDGD